MMFLWTLFGGYRGLVAACAATFLVSVAWSSYDRLIDDPGVVREARAGFVAVAERDALAALVAERDRQRLAAEMALSNLRREIDRISEQEQAAQDRLEQEIKDYEKKLADAGRLCPLDDGDIEWLQSK